MFQEQRSKWKGSQKSYNISFFLKRLRNRRVAVFFYSKKKLLRAFYAPTASVDAYKAAEDWSNYADYIEGYDF